MKLRGHRECTDCGTRWSYFETGEITCPDCDNPTSVAVSDPAEHTAGQGSLDLTPILADIDSLSISELAARTVERTRPSIASAGFVHTGELQSLADRHLVVTELHRVASTLDRRRQVSDAEAAYFLTLLRGATDGQRPDPSDVPESLHPDRALAISGAVETYCSDIRRFLGQTDRDRDITRALSTIRAHRKRIDALDGAVDPSTAERLVRATRDLSSALREDDETALARVSTRFD